MKKFKLFALAMMAMLSTNAFAQTIQSDGDWKYTGVNAVAKTATLVGLVDSKKGTVQDLKIPAKVKDEGGVEYTINAIADGAFEGDDAIKSVTFTASVKTIGSDAFLDASNLATVTFPEGSELFYIGTGAFANTFALEKIDLSKTKVYDLSSSTPFVTYKEVVDAAAVYYADAAEYNTAKGTTLTDDEFAALSIDDKTKTPAVTHMEAISNVALEELVLPARTSYIGTALAKLRALKKVNISETRVMTIDPYAFDGDKNLTALVLPAVYLYNSVTGEPETSPQNTYLADDALTGSYIQTLTINGNVAAMGALGATTLTEVTFNGDVSAIPANSFSLNLKLAKVTFKGNVAAGAIEDGSFTGCATTDDGAEKLTFTITRAAGVVFQGVAAFSATKVLDKAKCNVAITAPDAAIGTVPYRATFTASVAPATKVYVYGTSTYYGKYINSGTTAVNILRSDATVYSAYTDGSKVYMDPLKVDKGNQIIAAGQCVIVKTTSPKSADGKNFIEISALPKAADMPAEGHTMRIDGSADIINEIQGIYGLTTPNYLLAADVKDDECAADETLYVVGDLTQGLKWQTPKDNVKLYNNTLYIVAKTAEAAGRLEVIWLDGSEEEATAIKSVKTAAEKGAIYNLAGQKVNAAYKGVVIKDGKKYIQK